MLHTLSLPLAIFGVPAALVLVVVTLLVKVYWHLPWRAERVSARKRLASAPFLKRTAQLLTAAAALSSASAERDVFANVCRPPSQPTACNASRAISPAPLANCPHAQGKISDLRWCCWSAAQDGHISAAIVQGRVPGMEAQPIGYWSRLLSKHPPGIVIDAGAQVGLFTGTAVALGHHVLAVDARPDHAQMITTSLKLNGLSHAATVAHAALGSECGKTVTIQQDIVGNPGSSHVDDYRRRLLQLQEEKEKEALFNEEGAHASGGSTRGWSEALAHEELAGIANEPAEYDELAERLGLPSTPSTRRELFIHHRSKVPMLTIDSLLQQLRTSAPTLGVRPRATSFLGSAAPSAVPSNSPVHAIKLDVEGLEPRVFMGAAQLMLNKLRPKLVIMELFVERLRACDVRSFLGAFGELNYTLDVSPRLNMPYCGGSNIHRCQGLSNTNGRLAPFLNSLGHYAEMDLVFYQGHHPP